MKTYKIEWTQKYPYKYFIEIDGYIISTIDEMKFNEVVKQITEKNIIVITKQQINKLNFAGFTVTRKGV